jgi:hypothetical protein
MKKLFYYLPLLLIAFASCSDDEVKYVPSFTEAAIENLSEIISVAQEDTIFLKANIKSSLDSEFIWSVSPVGSSTEVSVTDSVFKFVSTELGDFTVTLSVANADGEVSAKIDLNVYGKFRNGTFILNEGSAFQENGSLIFINSRGEITDSVYWRVNGTELGNVSQDLFIANNKIYIISQSGRGNFNNYESDGMLIVANAETLKKETAYNEQISRVLSWPTHIAVLGNDNIFIRDSRRVYLFNTSTQEITSVAGTAGALGSRMAVAENKVFVPARNAILVLEAGKTEISHRMELGAAVSGVIRTSDSHLYVSTTGTPHKILKINAKDYSIIQTNEITAGGVGAGISAKGDTIYYRTATQIYRHIFSTGESEHLIDAKDFVEDAGLPYNALAVHPMTGEVYKNTIKGFGTDFLINNISVFNFSTSEPKLSVNYKNYTRFPAGIFFTDNFE